ncbi:MAG: hypothetical protein U0807_14500 [Candidatus Binatia bacterium]
MIAAPPTEQLNRDCRCIAVDSPRLARLLEESGLESGLGAELVRAHAHLFASVPVFISRAQVGQIEAIVRAVEQVGVTERWRAAALAEAPEIARRCVRARGVLFGYDFHVGREGPRLIEINTNAGGALLNVLLARAQQACCAEVRECLAGPFPLESREQAFVDAFRREWTLERGAVPLRRIAIVDDAPQTQFLYPEFVLFREAFRRAGFEVSIVAADALEVCDGRLVHAGEPIDLVYNRLTDFYLAAPEHAALRETWMAGTVVVTPHPRAHALLASKHNLVRLSDEAFLRATGIPDDAVRTLLAAVPRTVRVRDSAAADLWRDRRRYFFKPAAGYGSKAAYRGDKLTRRAWTDVLAGDYVAQQIVPPSERTIEVNGRLVPLKLDVRAYAYDGAVQLLASRLYDGQTTNFRTAGGGFAAVFSERAV